MNYLNLSECLELSDYMTGKKLYAVPVFSHYLGNGDPRPAQEKSIDDAKNSGAQAMVCLCPMCINNLSEISDTCKIPLLFLGDIERMALGESVPKPD